MEGSTNIWLFWKYLVLQDEACMISMEGQEGGSWRGTKFHIKERSVYQLVVEEKWAKTRHIIQNWLLGVMSYTPLEYKVVAE